MEVLVVSFVLDDVAVTFQLDSFSKGLVGSASFFGKPLKGGHWPISFTGICRTRVADASLAKTKQYQVRVYRTGCKIQL